MMTLRCEVEFSNFTLRCVTDIFFAKQFRFPFCYFAFLTYLSNHLIISAWVWRTDCRAR